MSCCCKRCFYKLTNPEVASVDTVIQHFVSVLVKYQQRPTELTAHAVTQSVGYSQEDFWHNGADVKDGVQIKAQELPAAPANTKMARLQRTLIQYREPHHTPVDKLLYSIDLQQRPRQGKTWSNSWPWFVTLTIELGWCYDYVTRQLLTYVLYLLTAMPIGMNGKW